MVSGKHADREPMIFNWSLVLSCIVVQGQSQRVRGEVPEVRKLFQLAEFAIFSVFCKLLSIMSINLIKIERSRAF